MAAEMEHLRQLAAALRGNLEKCADDPKGRPVHHLRTGTRRVQASVEMLVRESSDESVKNAAERWLRLLKKIRRAAGKVRDLDVHRKLLDQMVKRGGPKLSLLSDLENAPATVLTPQHIERQADDLDGWLKRSRRDQAAALRKKAVKWLAKFDKLARAFESATAARQVAQRRSPPAAVVALEAFASLAERTQHLDASNLHDFRKGAKKARYMAETGGDEHSRAVGSALKRVQDEIGEWHDRLVLAEEAHTALGHRGRELIAVLEAERDRHYVLAMKATLRLRGKLMGEWLSPGRQKNA